MPRPAIAVVTGLYPLAQAAEHVGGSYVNVTDVVPPGADPRTYQLSSGQARDVRRAAVVLLAGRGFQPSLDQAAATNRDVLDVGAYAWLDPPQMHQAITAIAGALAAADPGGAGTFRGDASAYADEVDSTGIDYESTLSACPRHTIITADGAFAAMARTYGLADQVVGTGSAVAPAAQAAQNAQATTAFSEPYVPDATLTAVAASAHLKVRTLDPLTGPPPGGWPKGADYIRLMEANLAVLNLALGCPDTSTGQ